VNGRYTPEQIPGHGVRFDRQALDRHALSAGAAIERQPLYIFDI